MPIGRVEKKFCMLQCLIVTLLCLIVTVLVDESIVPDLLFAFAI